jgi:hypothetical protein
MMMILVSGTAALERQRSQIYSFPRHTRHWVPAIG